MLDDTASKSNSQRIFRRALRIHKADGSEGGSEYIPNSSNRVFECTKGVLKIDNKNDIYMKAYNVAEVSKLIDVPPGTIRQWERSLEGVLRIPRDEKDARYYTDLEIQALRNIKAMRDKGLGFTTIREVLSNPEGNEMVPLPSVPAISQAQAIEALQQMQEVVAHLSSRMEEIVSQQVRQEVAAVLEENHRLHQQLEDKLEERDKHLMEALRTMQQTAEQLKSTRKRGSWWPWGGK